MGCKIKYPDLNGFRRAFVPKCTKFQRPFAAFAPVREFNFPFSASELSAKRFRSPRQTEMRRRISRYCPQLEHTSLTVGQIRNYEFSTIYYATKNLIKNKIRSLIYLFFCKKNCAGRKIIIQSTNISSNGRSKILKKDKVK